MMEHFCSIGQARSEIKNGYDQNYVASFRQRLHLAVFLASKGSNVTVYNVKNKSQTVQYAPNNFINSGFGINYRFIALETSFKLPFISTTDPKKGSSSVVNVRVNLIRQKFWLTGIMQRVGGFYQTNPETLDPDWFKSNTDYPLRSDIQQSLFYLTGNYIFNHTKFSYRSTINAYEHQLKSAGSFVTGVSLANYGASGDSSLLPELVRTTYSSESDIVSSRIFHVGLNAGYLHTFAIKGKFFVHLGAIGSFGQKRAKTIFAGQGNSVSEKNIGAIFDSRIAFGYNGERNFFSVNLNALSLPDNSKRRVEYAYQFLRLIYSRRM